MSAIDFTQIHRTGEAATRTLAGPSSLPGTLRILRKAVSWLTTGVLVLAVASFLALAIGPRLLGYQTATMLTGSMSPLINPGDVVITEPVPVSEIHVGDIITYAIPVEDHRVETHRITELTVGPDGSTAVRTKGDANNGADPWTATIQGTKVDRHVATVPHVGSAIRALRDPAVRNILMYGAPAVLVLSMLTSIWKKPAPAGSARTVSEAKRIE